MSTVSTMGPGIRFLLGVIALLSIAMGGLFLIVPSIWLEWSAASAANVGWLRNIGAALVMVQGVGTFVAINRVGNSALLFVLGVVSLAQAIALAVSLLLGEFSAERLYFIWGPAIAAGLSGIVYFVAARRVPS